MEAWTSKVLFCELNLEPTEATGRTHINVHGLQIFKLLMPATLPVTQ